MTSKGLFTPLVSEDMFREENSKLSARITWDYKIFIEDNSILLNYPQWLNLFCSATFKYLK